jgi:ATP-grasp domain, R2K clade family 2
MLFILSSRYSDDARLLSEVGYEGNGDPHWQAAKAFAQTVCDNTSGLPASFVIDVGILKTGAWAVIEFNPTWASGIYGCTPDKVLDCLEAAVV